MNSRRTFIKTSLTGSAVISLSGAVPGFLLGASRVVPRTGDDRVLVVVQLSGGNDGLNTVVPYHDVNYYKNRFTLAIGKQQVLKINRDIGFHPALRGFDELLQDGRLTVVQGVGYPNPNRSHFESMDLWHTAHRGTEPQLGWLGRSVDAQLADEDLPAMHLGPGLQPLALRTKNKPIPSVRSIEDFRLNIAGNRQAREWLQQLTQTPPHTSGNSLLDYLHQSSNVAMETSDRLEQINRSSRAGLGYPGSTLGRNLSAIARLIGGDLATRIYYTAQDGFDTHSNQAAAHQGLLGDLGNSLAAFMNELTQQGNDDRVAVLVFSEFGRRVRENASAGTDHGTAAPVFVLGSSVLHPVLGQNPDLQDLDQGDLRYSIDYRRVYADLLDNWLNINSEQVLGDSFQPTGLFS